MCCSCFFFLSLALVLPKYSELFIQAKLGDDIKEAMCEYDAHSNIAGRFDFVCVLQPIPIHIFFGLFSWVFMLNLWYSMLLDPQPLLCVQLSWLNPPTVDFFYNVTYWSTAPPFYKLFHISWFLPNLKFRYLIPLHYMSLFFLN